MKRRVSSKMGKINHAKERGNGRMVKKKKRKK